MNDETKLNLFEELSYNCEHTSHLERVDNDCCTHDLADGCFQCHPTNIDQCPFLGDVLKVLEGDNE